MDEADLHERLFSVLWGAKAFKGCKKEEALGDASVLVGYSVKCVALLIGDLKPALGIIF